MIAHEMIHLVRGLASMASARCSAGSCRSPRSRSHHDAEANPWLWVAVAACLLFSSFTVYAWTRLAFRSSPKALGFVVLLETIMTFASTAWLASAALVILVGINAIATGATLASRSPEKLT